MMSVHYWKHTIKKQLQVLKMAEKVHEGEVISIVLKRQVVQVGRAPVYSLHCPV